MNMTMKSSILEKVKSQKEELSRHNSNLQHSDVSEEFEDLPARITEMESEIRVLRDQNKRTYFSHSLITVNPN